jgi:hypothetical protein
MRLSGGGPNLFLSRNPLLLLSSTKDKIISERGRYMRLLDSIHRTGRSELCTRCFKTSAMLCGNY